MRVARPVPAAVGGLALLAACTSTVSGTGRLAPEFAALGGPTPTATGSTSGAPVPTAPPPSTAPGPTGPRIPAAVAGKWTGVMRQPSGVIDGWTLDLDLPAGQASGTFVIRGFCRGPATVLSATASTGQVVLRERITSDPKDRCAESGRLLVQRIAGQRLNVHWVDDAAGTNVANGVLSRR